MNEVEVEKSVSDIWIGRGQSRVGVGGELAADICMRGGCTETGNIESEGRDVAAIRNRDRLDRVALVGSAAEGQVLGHVVEAGKISAQTPTRNEGDFAGGWSDGKGCHVVGPGDAGAETEHGHQGRGCEFAEFQIIPNLLRRAVRPRVRIARS
jgi:hypothetical protein